MLIYFYKNLYKNYFIIIFIIMIQERPDWNIYFKEIVQVTSKRSPCSRLKVGCLLIKDNRIISQGYNGFLPGCIHKSILRDNHEQATIHAEQNALCDCAKRGVSSNDCTAYITHYPCLICTRLLIASGIKEIKYIEDYKNDELVAYFLEQKNIYIEKI
jgi:dCMP deaminase